MKLPVTRFRIYPAPSLASSTVAPLLASVAWIGVVLASASGSPDAALWLPTAASVAVIATVATLGIAIRWGRHIRQSKREFALLSEGSLR